MQTLEALDLARSPRATASTTEVQECVLLIEDNDDSMRLVEYALQTYGHGKYRLEWAKDLQSGIDRISKGGMDIVVLDLGLPDSSGASGLSWVHQIAPEMPVLVLTGDKRDGTEFAVITRGAYDYLVKDHVSGARLVQAIQATLDLSKKRRWNEMAALAIHTKTMLSELIQPAAQEGDST